MKIAQYGTTIVVMHAIVHGLHASQQLWSLNYERCVMKIVVIGGSGLIGKKLVTKLHERGHEAVAASPSSGVNAVTGAGLADVLVDAEVVVDATNSPSFEGTAVLEFFERSSRNLLAAEANGGVGDHASRGRTGKTGGCTADTIQNLTRGERGHLGTHGGTQ